MGRLVLPTEQVMQLTRVRTAKREFQLRLIAPDGLAPGKDNRWTNDKAEIFVSISGREGRKGHRIAIAGRMEDEEKTIVAQINVENGWLEIASIHSDSRVGYVSPPVEARGRGIFGLVLAETVAIALEQDTRMVSVIPDNKKLRYYYAGYNFVGSQKGALFLPVGNFSLEQRQD